MSIPAMTSGNSSEAAENAGGIRFEVSNFDHAFKDPGLTSWEFSQIVKNPALRKTTFIQNGAQVVWNGTGFVKP
jgi:hypothetical protein